MDRRMLKPLQLAVRAAAGATIAYAAARALNLDDPIIAFTIAVVVTDLEPAQTRMLGLRRLGATVVGAVTGVALSVALQPTILALGAGVLLAVLVSHLLRAREGAKVAGYICGLIVIDASAAPWRDALDRTLETALGVSVAWMISYVPKLIAIEEAGAESAASAAETPVRSGDPQPPR
jgi:uncharacterized membrane protein YgaE (UPF0421/DUF939 family)